MALIRHGAEYNPHAPYRFTPPGDGNASTITHVGRVTGKTSTATLYLPDNILIGGSTHTYGQRASYPIIVALHGKASSHASLANILIPRVKDDITAERIPPCIVLLPDASGDSWWTDDVAADSDVTTGVPIETQVMQELWPYVRAHTLTSCLRADQKLFGFSMGAFGALKLAARYYAQFSAVMAYAGPRLDYDFGGAWTGGDETAFTSIFGAGAGDPPSNSKYVANSPTKLFVDNKTSIQALGLNVRIAVGADDGTKTSVDNFDAELDTVSFTHTYGVPEVITGVGHSLTDLLANDVNQRLAPLFS